MTRRILGAVALCLILSTTANAQSPPPDAEWTADAAVEGLRAVSDDTLGAAQGIAVRDGKVYAYGDVRSPEPRVGVIREYDLDLRPTGRVVWLRRDGRPLILHPTGLTWDAKWGTFLGDTVNKKAMIYRLDWPRAWADGNLDHAVLDTLNDDAATNGCRPTFVSVKGRTLLATADYGDIRPEIRLLDPEALLASRRTGAPGVVVHRIAAGPWNQNLHWDAASGRLTCVQNVIEGRGWRLDRIDLAKAVESGRAVHVGTSTLPPHDELEGYWPLDADRSLLISSSQRDNIIIGVIRPRPPKSSPVGTQRLD